MQIFIIKFFYKINYPLMSNSKVLDDAAPSGLITSTGDIAKIKKQIEYYFSNANFSKDKFLFNTYMENDGKIGIDIIMTFNKLKKLTTNVEDVKKACVDSKIVKIEGENIIKKDLDSFKKYQEDSNVDDKTVAISGFNTKMSFDEIEEYLKKVCTPIRILMRRRRTREFSGTCFVEFNTIEEAKNVLSLKLIMNNKIDNDIKDEDDVKKSKLTITGLKVMMKNDYIKNIVDVKHKKIENDVEKIKKDFIPKLYKIITNKTLISKRDDKITNSSDILTISDIKKVIPNTAFVDFKKSIIRLQFMEDWSEKEFADFKLQKLSEEEAKDYVNTINIKPIRKTNKKK